MRKKISDPEVAELRRRHVTLGVPLETLSAQTGLKVDSLHRIVTGRRRAKAGGPLKPKVGHYRTPPQVTHAVRQEIAAGRKHYAIARKHGVSKWYVNQLARDMRENGTL